MTATASTLAAVTEELRGSITMLLEALRERSALILLFAGIDILGALDTADGEATKLSFINWADKYMAPQAKLGCSSLELYSARCGVLHALSAQTRLAAQGSARQFVFVTYPPVFPEDNVEGGPFVVSTGNLWLAFRDGMVQFQADAIGDSLQADRVERNLAGVYFTRSR